MKSLVIICIFALLINLTTQIPHYENCDRQVLTGSAVKDCVKVTCLNKKDYKIKGCDTVVCQKGKQVGYHNGNEYEEYPACCSHPVCAK